MIKMKKIDYVVILLVGVFFGIAIITQFYTGQKTKKIIQPETNEVMAVEIAKVAKTNENLRIQIGDLTKNYNQLKSASTSRTDSYQKYKEESYILDSVNGIVADSGQGVVIIVNGQLSTPQLVDLVNAIKNIGTYEISINDKRIILSTYIDSTNFSAPIRVKALGNSSVLESALTRNGGIIEQIRSKGIGVEVIKSENLMIPSGEVRAFNFGKVIQ